MKNGSYKAIKDTTLMGMFSMADVEQGQIVSVIDGDHDNTVFVQCGPACTIEVERKDTFNNFEPLT